MNQARSSPVGACLSRVSASGCMWEPNATSKEVLMSKTRRPKGAGSIRNRGTERVPRWFAYHNVVIDGRRRQISEGAVSRARSTPRRGYETS